MTSTRPEKSQLYYPKMPANWWLRKRNYLLFMLRELSSVFIALFLAVFLVQIYRLGEGAEYYAAYMRTFSSPGWILFHLVALAFALLHSVTWFQSSAVVLQLRLGEQEVPRSVVMGLHLVVWLVASVVILWIFIVY
ncbi:MAG TPA: hypothetical protein VGB25_11730 [Candidatus Binatia bacterium]